jgi:hypothetical protein
MRIFLGYSFTKFSPNGTKETISGSKNQGPDDVALPADKKYQEPNKETSCPCYVQGRF